MTNPQIDQFMNALMWKAAPVIFLGSLAALFIREGLQWVERRATRFGRERRRRREAEHNREPRRSQTAATGSEAARISPTSTLEEISWENFELLVGEIFRRKGFEVEISSGLGADGGKDLILRRDGEARLVQCKRLSPENKVSVMAMREFYGLVVAENVKRGIFVTTGLFSREAREFAEGKPIKLVGRGEIEQLMASVARPGENLCNIREWIRDFATGANVTDPDCPRCRKPMKLRRGVTGSAFWGCSSLPRCRGKRNARTELVRAYS